jgi:hypothetical protein
VIEIFTRMSYIISCGTKLGLGSSGLLLQTSWIHADAKTLVIDNGGSLVKELPLTPCVIEIVPGFGRARNELGFQSPMTRAIERSLN